MPNSYRKILTVEELCDQVANVETSFDSFRFWVDDDNTLYEVGIGFILQDEDMPYIETIDGFEDGLQYLLKYNKPINKNTSLKNINIDDVEILDLQVEHGMIYEEICKMLIKKCNIKKNSYITKARRPSAECVLDRGLYSIEFSDDVWKKVKKIKKF